MPDLRLARGVVLVDSPGFGGVYPEHTATINAFLPLAQAVVLVTDVTRPLTASEVAFVQSAAVAAQVANDADGLIIAVTRADLVGVAEAPVQDVRVKVAAAVGRAPADVPVLAVSAQAKLDYLAGGDPEDLEASNLPVFEELLWNALAQRRPRALLVGVFEELSTAVRQLAEPVHAELAVLDDAVSERAEQVRGRARYELDRLARLEAFEAQWRGTLADQVRTAVDLVYRGACADVERVWPGGEGSGTVRWEQVTGDAALLVGVANRRLTEACAEARATVMADCGFELARIEVGRVPFPVLATVRSESDHSPPLSPVPTDERVRGALSGTEIGTSVGRVIGEALFPGLGGRIGSAIGAALGAWLGATFSRGRRGEIGGARTVLPAADIPWDRLREELLDGLEQELRRLADVFVLAMTADLDSRIAAERFAASDALRRAERVSHTDQRSTERRRSQLDAVRVELDRIGADVTRLAGNPR